MQYLGGKTRLKKHLAPIVRSAAGEGLVWDAFCGGLAMAEELSKGGPVIATDACVPLIALYQAVLAGWEPPCEVTKAVYDAARSLPDTDPMKGFCGFLCSFSGMYFQGYVPAHREHTVASGPSAGLVMKNSPHSAGLRVLRRQLPKLAAVGLADFLQCPPRGGVAAVYCDPPYRGTAGYAGVAPFDHDAFYRHVECWAAVCPVFVSEYECPIGALVWEAPAYTQTRTTKRGAVERMYRVG